MTDVLPLRGVQGCVFDAYGTLFDFAAAARKCRDVLGDEGRLRTRPALRARERTRAREIIEEFSLGSIASPVRATASRARRYQADHADIGAGLVGAAIGQR